MPRNERLRWLLWLLSGVIAIGGLWYLKRATPLQSRRDTEVEIRLSEAFWQSEAGNYLSSAEKSALIQWVARIPDTLTRTYALGVTYMLLYATEALQVPPMIYVQRLQQMREDPWVKAYLGRLSWHTGQADKALQYLNEAITEDSTCGPAYLFLAGIQKDSACYWLKLSDKATLPPGAKAYRQNLISRFRCSG
ncbi:MAG: hypothetical protein RMJ66_04385 [Bacteroidia bacterium]|nr:hypothetical protein [Bacteroidia bacterium]MDW8134284.1 hypothetical protein [Bacteroidia bacterium]